MIYSHQRPSIALLLVILINIACGNPLLKVSRKEAVTVDDDHYHQLRRLLTPEGKAAFQDSLKSLNDAIHSHLVRNLQELPPPFEPARACNEFFTTVTAEEVAQIVELYFLALFPPGSENESLVDVARSVLLSQAKYDMKVAKVCMSCADARNVIASDLANNVENYGFGTYCADGAFGSDAMQSALVFVPTEVGSDTILQGQIRGFISNRGTTSDLYFSPSEFWPANITNYILSNTIEQILLGMTDYLAPAIFGVWGAIAIAPDFVGYGESYLTPRAYFVLGNMAQSGALAWLATQEFVRTVSNGCTVLEAAASVSGYSEGGTATIPVALALRQLEVRVVGAYVGGAAYTPTLLFSSVFEKFAEDAPDLESTDLFLWKLFLPMVAYSHSIENSFLENTGSGQILLSQNYSQGGVETNIYDWFDPPAELTVSYAFTQFVPDNVVDVMNQDLKAIYDEARAAGVADACSNFVSNTTDKLCETILSADLVDDMTNLIDFKTVLCHSEEDQIIPYSSVPSFPNTSMISKYEGIMGFLLPEGSHEVAKILCSVSPISQLQNTKDDGPVLITPLEECLVTEPSAPPQQENVPTAAPPDNVPTDTPQGEGSTATPSGSDAGGLTALLEFSSIVSVFMTAFMLMQP